MKTKEKILHKLSGGYKFKIGDKVKVKSNYCEYDQSISDLFRNKKGKIIRILLDGGWPAIGVKLNKLKRNKISHNLGGTIKNSSGWYFSKKDLELI